jgi:hypothetical protein
MSITPDMAFTAVTVNHLRQLQHHTSNSSFSRGQSIDIVVYFFPQKVEFLIKPRGLSLEGAIVSVTLIYCIYNHASLSFELNELIPLVRKVERKYSSILYCTVYRTFSS